MNRSDITNNEITRLQQAKEKGWETMEKEILNKRLQWFENNKETLLPKLRGSDLEKAYQLLLIKLGIDEREAPVIEKTENRILFHSMNFCPTLEACKKMGWDTREVCRAITEKPTEELIKKINPKLRFGRNYGALRPNTPYCEEMIFIDSGGIL